MEMWGTSQRAKGLFGTMKTTWVVMFLKWLVSAFAGLWITIPIAVQLLVVLSFADLVSSIANPGRHLRDVLRRLALMMLLVMVIYYVYTLAKQQTGFNVGFDLGAAVCTFYILGELVYMLQNCAAAGLALPPRLLSLLAKAEDLTLHERSQIADLQAQQVTDRMAKEVERKAKVPDGQEIPK